MRATAQTLFYLPIEPISRSREIAFRARPEPAGSDAAKIETPLVIMHGDEDEAVSWYQSIEFYLALRRLGKDAVFLQYRDEPHHPRKYANKLDYSIRMKEFFDHHLKGAPAPDWWVHGIQYRGK